ncbi:universal stress protein [Streptomyces sp. NPDC056628]|uniref:universal stress protein n=1 Tax=Streptomyces sp. NPDC056628 TaxID=3345882 RepID=UPI0036A4C843
MTGPVVVGLDASPASMTAAWWAAREAAERQLPVLLLHSWTTQPLNVPVPQEALSKPRYGGQVLQRAQAELLHRHAGLTVTTDLTSEHARQALLDLSETASMLVLGSRGHGAPARFMLGSVSMHVLGLTRCPAVTVRAGGPAVEEGWGRPVAHGRDEVLVGVRGDGPVAAPLLEFAFAAAQVRGKRVRVVRALSPASVAAHPHTAFERSVTEERARLAEQLAPWREKFPDVAVVERVEKGSPAHALLSEAEHSRLTVVGRRRHASALTWKLGPVAHAALHHMPCPVAVVPHH